MTVRMRQEVERKIAAAAIQQLLAAGYLLGVNDGEETTIQFSRDAKAVEAALFTTDEDWLYVYVDRDQDDPLNVERDPRPDYWVRFIYGNDGYDVISDYSVHLEKDLTEAEKLADYYGGDGPFVPLKVKP